MSPQSVTTKCHFHQLLKQIRVNWVAFHMLLFISLVVYYVNGMSFILLWWMLSHFCSLQCWKMWQQIFYCHNADGEKNLMTSQNVELTDHTGLFPYFLREFTWKIASIPIQYFPRDFSFAFIKIFPRKGNPILTHNIFYLEAVWIACRKRDEFSFSVSHNRWFYKLTTIQ